MIRKYTYLKYLSLIIFLMMADSSLAQLTVSNAKTPTELVQDVLLGSGVKVFNVSYTGSNNARGEFNSVNANVGFDAGVLLTSGFVNFAIGPNNRSNRSGNNGRPGDADINTIISPTTSRDAAVLEFDFRVAADTVFFDYVFASEEYPEYAPPFSSSFNDAFAFLLTGPNPAGGSYNKLNIARIPGTTIPVSINNVNAITNNSYYVNNGNGFQSPYNSDPFYIQYDGFTIPLTATAAVVPCAMYHIKLVVADAADFVYDSGVFLEANSFGANVKNPVIDFISTAPSCDGDSVDFLSTGTSSPGILYSWNFGAGAVPATSSLENPANIVYGSPGLKLVTLDMNVNCGDTTLTKSTGITIDETPVPSFLSNAPQCENQPVNFTYNGSTGATWTYLWDFGSGAKPSVSTAKDPSGIIYGSAGIKTVTLTVSNGNCKEVITQTITINDRPRAAFIATGPVGIGYGVDFTNKGTTGINYSWNFGTGASPSISNVENPVGVIYNSAGTKAITMISSNALCADTTTGFVDILVTPAPSFISNAPQPVGFPLIFTYNGSTGNNFTYSWDFGSGALPSTSNSPNPPSIFYSSPGTKTITLTVTNGPIVVTITSTVIIDQPPQSSFTSTAPNCEGANIDFQAMGQSGMTFVWDFGIDAIPTSSTSANPTNIVYSSPGFKTVKLLSTLGGNTDSSEQTIYIIPQPKPVFSHNGPKCEGSPIDFTYSGNTGSGWLFNWDFGNGSSPNTSSATNPVGIQYNGSGSKIVGLSVTNAFCSAVDTQFVLIEATPTASFFNSSNVCTGDSVNYGNTGSKGLTYAWDFGSGSIPTISTDENPMAISYTTAGIKTVTQIVSLGQCSDTALNTINVIERPQPSFTHNAPQCMNNGISINYTGTSNSNWSYQWDFGQAANPPMSAIKIPSEIKYSNAGTKTITLTVSNQFCSATDTQIILIDTTPVASLFTSAPACQGDTFALFANGFSGNSASYSFTYNLFSTNAFHDAQKGKAVYMDHGIQRTRLIMGIGNCFDSTEISFNVREKPVSDFTSTAPVCQNAQVDFFNTGIMGSWLYSWDFGTSSFPGTSSAENPQNIRFNQDGKHQVSLKTYDLYCSSVDTMSIFINALPDIEAGVDTIICADDCIEIGESPEAGFSYKWFPASLLNNSILANPVACPSAEFTQLILSKTNDTNSCMSKDTLFITMLTSAMADAGADVEVCYGDSVQIGSALVKGQTYTWTPAQGLSNNQNASPKASPQETTTYKLEVSYKNCSVIEDEVMVTIHKSNANAGEDLTLARGESVELKGSGGVVYEWSPADFLSNPYQSNPLSTPEESITYVLDVRDVFNCESTDSMTITVVDPSWFIPSAFTPNNSGSNDVFRVRGERLSKFEMSIFDRSGNLVYFSSDFYSGWDGTNQKDNSILPAGAYVYRVKGIDELGEDVVFSGLVNLIR